MNTNKFVGGGLIASLIIAFLISAAVTPFAPIAAGVLFTIDGLAFVVFSIWASVKLLNLK
jgi:hypothetical protein